jgi:hypothetical protein
MTEMKIAFKILVWKPEEKGPLVIKGADWNTILKFILGK